MGCGCEQKGARVAPYSVTTLKRGESAIACLAEDALHRKECCRSKKYDHYEYKHGKLSYKHGNGYCKSDCVKLSGRCGSKQRISFDKDIYVDECTGYKYIVRRERTNSSDPHDPESVPVFYLLDEQCEHDHSDCHDWDKRKKCDPCKKLDKPSAETSVCELIH